MFKLYVRRFSEVKSLFQDANFKYLVVIIMLFLMIAK